MEEAPDEKPTGLGDLARGVVDQAMSGVAWVQKQREAEREARAKAKAKDEQFTSWFGAMGNNQLKMQQQLTESAIHFG